MGSIRQGGDQPKPSRSFTVRLPLSVSSVFRKPYPAQLGGTIYNAEALFIHDKTCSAGNGTGTDGLAIYNFMLSETILNETFRDSILSCPIGEYSDDHVMIMVNKAKQALN